MNDCLTFCDVCGVIGHIERYCTEDRADGRGDDK